ncbi:hypothetical protein Dimus_019089 [Dionaea muscipula]
MKTGKKAKRREATARSESEQQFALCRPPGINSSSSTRKRIVSPQSKARRHREANLFLELTPRGELAFGAVESTLQKHGWDPCTKLDIDRVLRVNHKDHQVLNRFEKYRSDVMDKASGSKNTIGVGLVSERVFADGNEILCFRGASLICGLGSDGRDTICGRRSCGVCRLMRIVEEGSTCGSSHEKDNVWPMLLSLNSWRAHKKAAKKCCGNGGCGGGGRKAIVICRVIAGCVGNFVKKENNIMECEGFDSALLSIGGDNNNCSDQDLLVLNPTAVLPCFVVVYNASS